MPLSVHDVRGWSIHWRGVDLLLGLAGAEHRRGVDLLLGLAGVVHWIGIARYWIVRVLVGVLIILSDCFLDRFCLLRGHTSARLILRKAEGRRVPDLKEHKRLSLIGIWSEGQEIGYVSF
jgi:hypothetical protein